MPYRLFVYLFLLLYLTNPIAASAKPRVLTSIAPINALVSGITHGIMPIDNLISSDASPHHYVLKPSDARRLAEADLIVWIGPQLEGFLAKPLLSIDDAGRVLTLMHISELDLINHSNEHAKAVDESDFGQIDPHIWLSPYNARRIVTAITDALIKIDAANRQAYLENAEKLSNAIKNQEIRLKKQLANYQHRPFIVQHDAYQYFVQHYGLNQAGYISRDDENRPGARHLSEIRQLIRRQNITCLFTKPGAYTSAVHILSGDTGAMLEILDPIGAKSDENPLAYIGMISRMAENFMTCLE